MSKDSVVADTCIWTPGFGSRQDHNTSNMATEPGWMASTLATDPHCIATDKSNSHVCRHSGMQKYSHSQNHMDPHHYQSYNKQYGYSNEFGRYGYVQNGFSNHGYGVTLRQLCRRRFISKVCKSALSVVLVFTIIVNITLIRDSSRRLHEAQARHELQEGIEMEGDESFRMEGRSIKQVTEPPRTVQLEVHSSRNRVYMAVDGALIYEDREKEQNRGIHIVVLNQATGSIMATRLFDTYVNREDEAMTLFLSLLKPGRILLIAIKDEASQQLKQAARDMLGRLGSAHARTITWRDMWAMIAVKQEGLLKEELSSAPDTSSWGRPVTITTSFTLRPLSDAECTWPDSEVNVRRRHFCGRFEGYGSVCSCTRPAPLVFQTKPLEEDNTWDIPVVVIASDRPHYLYRMLRSLLAADGVNPSMVTIFVDGYFEGPVEVARLFGLTAIQHTPLGEKRARISQHYRASLTATFNNHPKAKYAIILEEDLDVSPDIFSYFSQTVALLEEDDSLYCVSAWNDQGYEHSCHDPALLYRVETMPGLGWVLKRSLFKEELEANWPTSEKQWDWDMWLRMPNVRRGRECIVPDVPRTFHFGARGLNVRSRFQDAYFQKHTLNTLPNVKLKDVDSLTQDAYEELLHNLVQSATLLDHAGDPCAEAFVPNDLEHQPHVLYIDMRDDSDYVTWKRLAKCLEIWDLDVRGVHKSMWRFFLNSTPVLVVGTPASPYAIYKPEDVIPIFLEDPEDDDEDT